MQNSQKLNPMSSQSNDRKTGNDVFGYGSDHQFAPLSSIVLQSDEHSSVVAADFHQAQTIEKYFSEDSIL